VRGPDGREYEVKGPDTPAAPPAPPEKPSSPVSESDMENFRAGAGRALVRAGRGVKQLIDPLATGLETVFGGERLSKALGMPTALESARQTDQAVAEARQLDKPLMDTKAGIAGDIAGNIAMTAVPGARLQKALGTMLGTGRLATALAAGGSGAGTEFVTAEGGLGDKAKSAAVAGALGTGMTGALGLVAKPFQASDDAVRLYAQGVNPTLQQAAEGAPGRFIGGLAAGGQGVRDRQRLELSTAALKRIGATPTDDLTGRGIAAAAKESTGAEYDALLNPKTFDLTPQDLDNALLAAQATNAQGQMVEQSKAATRAVKNIIGPSNLNTGTRQVPNTVLYGNYLTPLNEAVEKARKAGDDEVARRLLASRRALLDVRDAQLSPDELATLRNIDVRNFDVKRLQEATKGDAGEKTGVSLNALAKAYGATDMAGNTTREQLIGPMVRTIGKANNANASRSAAQTYARIGAPLAIGGGAAYLGAPMVAAPLAAAYGISALGQTARGARALTGQTALQKKLADLLRYGAPIAPALTDLEGSNYAP
jgi:hypothetical protein